MNPLILIELFVHILIRQYISRQAFIESQSFNKPNLKYSELLKVKKVNNMKK